MKNNRPIFFLLILIIVSGVCFFVSSLGEKKEKILPEETIENFNSETAAIIVPHHDLDKDDRKALLSEVKDRVKKKTILLVSTNHFDSGSSNISTTSKTWELANGTISPDLDIINAITESVLAVNNESIFSDEHGIKNVLPDIAEYFPKKNIVPIIIKPGTGKQDLEKLSEKLISVCDGNCLLVSSVDFSHYQPRSLSQIHDDLSIRALSNLDESLLPRVEVDSRETLALTIMWAKANKTEKFNLFKNTNSGILENNRDGESTSYVLGWYGNGEAAKKTDNFTFTFAGDMMFDRQIDFLFRGDKLVDSMSNLGNRLFTGVDLSLANLEGPISAVSIPADNTKDNLIFNFPPKTVDVLSWLGINAVSLANNHSLNNGQAGLLNTKEVLSQSNIVPIGQDGIVNDDSIKRFQFGAKNISVLAVDELNNSVDLAPMIKQEKEKGSFVFVFPHWGIEYQTVHSFAQTKLAHSWIEAGADIVIGSHPHVVQDAEIYQGKPIFYSLGNLIFDQNFSKETQRGLIISGRVSEGKIELALLPTIINNFKPELMRGQEKTEFLKKFNEYLGVGKEKSVTTNDLSDTIIIDTNIK